MTSSSADVLAPLLRVVHPSWLRAARARERPEVARWLAAGVEDDPEGAVDLRAVRAVRRRLAAGWPTGRAFLVARLGPEGADALDARALRPAVRTLARLQLAGALVAELDASGSSSPAVVEPLEAARAALGDGPRPDLATVRRSVAAVARWAPVPPAQEPAPRSEARLALAFGLYGLACAAPDRSVARGLARRLSRSAGRWLEALDAELSVEDRTSAWAGRLRDAAFPAGSRAGAA